MKKETTAPLFKIGNDELQIKDTIELLTKSFMEVIGSPGGDDVKIAAINGISEASKIDGISIMNCNFTGGGVESKS